MVRLVFLDFRVGTTATCPNFLHLELSRTYVHAARKSTGAKPPSPTFFKALYRRTWSSTDNAASVVATTVSSGTSGTVTGLLKPGTVRLLSSSVGSTGASLKTVCR